MADCTYTPPPVFSMVTESHHSKTYGKEMICEKSRGTPERGKRKVFTFPLIYCCLKRIKKSVRFIGVLNFDQNRCMYFHYHSSYQI